MKVIDACKIQLKLNDNGGYVIYAYIYITKVYDYYIFYPFVYNTFVIMLNSSFLFLINTNSH